MDKFETIITDIDDIKDSIVNILKNFTIRTNIHIGRLSFISDISVDFTFCRGAYQKQVNCNISMREFVGRTYYEIEAYIWSFMMKRDIEESYGIKNIEISFRRKLL